MAGMYSKGRLLRPWLRTLERAAQRSQVPQRGGQQRRGLFGGFSSDVPADPHGQARYLRDLNRRSDPESVIRAFESGQLAVTDATLSEYVKALVKVDRLDGSQLLRTLQRGATNVEQALTAPPMQAAAPSFASAGLGAPSFGATAAAAVATNGPGSSEKIPLYMQQVEPPFRTQFWRTVRWLAGTFLIISGINVLFEDRGITRGVLNNPDLRPQMETKTKFADVKGVDEAKAELEEIVDFLRNPSRFTALGGKLPKGVLLVGPPGTGKTMLARAIAGEAGVPFFYCSGSEFEEMFVGVGARRVRDLFAAAKKTAPCIVFIDEIDAIGSSRNPKDQQYMKMTLNQLLVELDGFKPSEGVIVVAATNFPQSLDKALVRPGRFDRHIVVPNPDVKGRRQILEVHFKKIPRAKDVDLSIIARGTPGFSGADLANLVNLAALKAAQDGQTVVGMGALEYARERIMMGAERKGAVISEKTRRNTAYHEGGHAIVALLTPGAHPVHKATIVPRGMALGMVQQLPEEDQVSLTKKQLLAELNVLMGGKAAEELIEGVEEVSTGASNDLERATKLARDMVTKYGMSSRLGQLSIPYNSVLSPETRAEVEKEVNRLLAEAYSNAKNILKTHEKELHLLAKELLEKETLTGEQIRELLDRSKGGSRAAV